LTSKGVSDRQHGVHSVKIYSRQYNQLREIAVKEGRFLIKILEQAVEDFLRKKKK
jgi:hypothetical protein